MTRHGKNCTAGSVYTYHEKQQDSKKSGWGSTKARLSKDGIKDFDCCSITLQPCDDPVVTQDGHLYNREAILEYILHQKQVIAKKMKAFKKQLDKEAKESKVEESSGDRKKVESFLKIEKQITTKRENPFTPIDGGAGSSKKMKFENNTNESVSNTADEAKKKELPSFWIPSLTPQATEEIAKKPDTKTYCPMSGKPLKVKNLIKVNFTRAPDEEKDKALVAKTVRYMCPVTNDVLGNHIKAAVLKPSGHVVTMECVEKFIHKDWVCPLTGEKLTPEDIIVLQQGGTGFAGGGQSVETKAYGPSMVAG